MNMTLAQAVEKAETFINGKVKDTGYVGFREVMARLLEEVKKNDNPAAQFGVCNCNDCHCEEPVNGFDEMANANVNPQGPLPANLLADMMDHLADEMAETAKEIDIYSISHTHGNHADELRGAARQVVQWAQAIREEV